MRLSHFPNGVVAIKDHEGYYWDQVKQCVLSLKQGGVLKEIKCYTANNFTRWMPSGTRYYITYENQRARYLRKDILAYEYNTGRTDHVLPIHYWG